MGWISALERAIESIVEGIFRRGRSGGTHPIEIARKLVREMEDQKRISVSRVYVPNEYTVSLDPGDVEKMSSIERTIALEMSQYLEDQAKRRGYYLIGFPVIRFVESSDVKPGTVTIESKFVEARPGEYSEMEPGGGPVESTGRFCGDVAEPAAGPVVSWDAEPTTVANGSKPGLSEPELVIEEGIQGIQRGERFRLGRPVVTLGRQEDNDICLADPNVSRSHARVELRGTSFYIIDLDSTNGTFINGERVTERKLAGGDLIRVGRTLIRFRVG